MRLLALMLAAFASTAAAGDPRLLIDPNAYGQPIAIGLVVAQSLEIKLSGGEQLFEMGLAVTGTYSSSDRYGIEGLAIIDGDVRSSRFQSWDGVLVLDRERGNGIYHKSAVIQRYKLYDLTDPQARKAFISSAVLDGASVIQSHLLINDFELDIREVENAPRFVRRILFQTREGKFGLYQSLKPLTLYQAASELQALMEPKMALNLDMGAYDFCRRWSGLEYENCGDPSAGYEKLTNILTLVFYPY